jgi:membrane protease YdiL (CAAX protease family)
VTPYHRAGHASRWRALGELLLAVVLWFVLLVILVVIEERVGGVKRAKDLPPDARMLTTFLDLAALGPAALIAARLCGRRASTLWSVAGRVRWRWLATCLLVALAVRAISPILLVVELVTGHKTFVGADTFAWQLALVVALVPLQALAEELFFRGTLLQAVGTFARSPWPAIVISAGAFGLAHGLRLPLFTAMAIVGLVLGWLAVRTGGLEAGIANHVALNVIGMATQLAVAGGDHKGVNAHVRWASTAISAAFVLLYAIIIKQLAKRLPAVPDQVEQHAAERGVSVEHADHGGDAEPLPPQQ